MTDPIDEWWAEWLPIWRSNPALLEHVERLAELHGREWVRENKREIDGRWNNAVEHQRVRMLIERYGDRWQEYF
jgi:hypothetical protein